MSVLNVVVVAVGFILVGCAIYIVWSHFSYEIKAVRNVGNIVESFQKDVIQIIQANETQHRKCPRCGKLGHMQDMTPHDVTRFTYCGYMQVNGYFHDECYAKEFNAHRCPDGGEWISDKKAGNERVKP